MKPSGKLLIVTWEVPPSISPSTIIVSHLASALGADCVVLAGQPPRAALVQGRHVPDHDVVHLRRPRRGRGENTLRTCAIPMLARRIRRLIQDRQCDALLAVFPDEAYLAASWWAARKTGCRFYPYFHNTYLENRTGWRLSLAAWLQPRVFKHADHVFVMSQGMVELFRKNYPSLTGCSALVHTFSEPLPVFTEPPPPGEFLRFAFCGSLNQSCLDAGRRLFDAVSQVPGAHLDVYSNLPRSYFESQCVLPKHTSVQRLSREDPALLRGLNKADILLLPHGLSGGLSQVEYETIFPTKTIEYLISGRPILAHTPPGAFLTRFLNHHDCALVVDSNDRAALSAAIDRLSTDAALRARLVRNALRAAEQFQVNRVVGHLRHIIGPDTPEQLTR